MPSRDHRDLKQNTYYHIFNRANWKMKIFYEDKDYQQFISLLIYYCKRYKQKLVSFCLMPNHYHLVIKINSPSAFVSMIQAFTSVFVRNYNNKYNTVGHLFQDKYKHRELYDLFEIVYAVRYVHRNPKDIDFPTSELLDYPWSSFFDFTRINPEFELYNRDILNLFSSYNEFVEFTISDKKEFELRKRFVPYKIEGLKNGIEIDMSERAKTPLYEELSKMEENRKDAKNTTNLK